MLSPGARACVWHAAAVCSCHCLRPATSARREQCTHWLQMGPQASTRHAQPRRCPPARQGGTDSAVAGGRNLFTAPAQQSARAVSGASAPLQSHASAASRRSSSAAASRHLSASGLLLGRPCCAARRLLPTLLQPHRPVLQLSSAAKEARGPAHGCAQVRASLSTSARYAYSWPQQWRWWGASSCEGGGSSLHYWPCRPSCFLALARRRRFADDAATQLHVNRQSIGSSPPQGRCGWHLWPAGWHKQPAAGCGRGPGVVPRRPSCPGRYMSGGRKPAAEATHAPDAISYDDALPGLCGWAGLGGWHMGCGGCGGHGFRRPASVVQVVPPDGALDLNAGDAGQEFAATWSYREHRGDPSSCPFATVQWWFEPADHIPELPKAPDRPRLPPAPPARSARPPADGRPERVASDERRAHLERG